MNSKIKIVRIRCIQVDTDVLSRSCTLIQLKLSSLLVNSKKHNIQRTKQKNKTKKNKIPISKKNFFRYW